MGEEIGYRRHPSFQFTFIRAKVERQIVDVSTGEVLQNSIRLMVSKSDVPAVMLGKDEVKLTSEIVPLGQAAPRYKIESVVEESPGFFVLTGVNA